MYENVKILGRKEIEVVHSFVKKELEATSSSTASSPCSFSVVLESDPRDPIDSIRGEEGRSGEGLQATERYD